MHVVAIADMQLPAGAPEQQEGMSQQQQQQQQQAQTRHKAPPALLPRLVLMLVATCVATAGIIAQNTELQQQIRRQLLPIQVGCTS